MQASLALSPSASLVPVRTGAPTGMTLRPYQASAVEALFQCWDNGDGGSHLIVASVGSGKTVMVSAIAKEAYERGYARRILVLTHVMELVANNFVTLKKYWIGAPAGLFSASFGRKDRAPVTVGSIQSVVNVIDTFGVIDLVCIDEAHLISPESDTSYQKVLDVLRAKNPNLKIVGLTGTPYRLNSGNLTEPYKGKPPLFDTIVAEITPIEMLREGNICPLVTKSSKIKVDLSKVRTLGGEFKSNELDAAVNTEEINRAAIAEVVAAGADRKSWLIFAITIDHAQRLAAILREHGIEAQVVCSNKEITPKAKRIAWVNAFKSFKLRCIVNVGCLTTGFDHPGLDLIAILRPTKSPGLFEQMLGRGVRNFVDSLGIKKLNCLVLDFAGNSFRLGVFGEIRGVFKREKAEEALAIECPECQTLVPKSTENCPTCGTVLIEKREPSDAKPDRESKLFKGNTATRIATQLEDLIEFSVKSATFGIHHARRDNTPMLALSYEIDGAYGEMVREYLCFDHRVEGTSDLAWPARIAQKTWRQRTKTKPPFSVQEAASRIGELALPKVIVCKKGDKGYWQVVSAKI